MKKKNMKDHEKCINHESMINFESVREINFLIRMNMMLKLESIFLMILVFFYGLKSNTKIQWERGGWCTRRWFWYRNLVCDDFEYAKDIHANKQIF
jgi:hypothetical protein